MVDVFPCVVHLEPDEVRHALDVGMARQLAALRRGLHNRAGAPAERSELMHAGGALAEKAVSKWSGIYWHARVGVIDRDRTDLDGDVGPFHVRYSTFTPPDLRLDPRDRDRATFFLVTGLPPDLTIEGWLVAADGKRDCYWRNLNNGRPPLFLVPANHLRHDIGVRSRP